MTMQIGMVGKNCVVLASDTRWTREPRKLTSKQVGRAVRYGTNGIKIKVSESREIAVSFAADKPSAESIADRLIARLTVNDSPDAQTAVQEIFDSTPVRGLHHIQGFIVLTRPALQLFRFEIARTHRKWIPSCEIVLGYDVTGDITNAALFWTERYHYESLPIEHLVSLAAHLVISSHYLNTAGIGGLELIECDAAGVRLLHPERIAELQDKAKEWDRRIGEIVYGKESQ
jgi:hypothetical protein